VKDLNKVELNNEEEEVREAAIRGKRESMINSMIAQKKLSK